MMIRADSTADSGSPAAVELPHSPKKDVLANRSSTRRLGRVLLPTARHPRH